MRMTYGYARCSTNEERQDVNRQKRELIAMEVSRATIYNYIAIMEE